MYSHIITPHYGDTTLINIIQRELVVYVFPPVAFSYYFVIIDIHHLPLLVTPFSVCFLLGSHEGLSSINSLHKVNTLLS